MAAASGRRQGLKIIVIGDSEVGKTNLLSRFTKDEFSLEQATTVGIDIAKDSFKLDDGTVVQASLHDTAGQERYRAITTNFYREADGAMLVYDCTLPQSLHGCSTWLRELRSSAPSDIPVILVGNKADRANRRVTQEEGLAFADTHKLAFAETSALDGSGVNTAFTALLTQAHRVRSTKEAKAATPAGGGANGNSREAGTVSPKDEKDPMSGCCG